MVVGFWSLVFVEVLAFIYILLIFMRLYDIGSVWGGIYGAIEVFGVRLPTEAPNGTW